MVCGIPIERHSSLEQTFFPSLINCPVLIQSKQMVKSLIMQAFKIFPVVASSPLLISMEITNAFEALTASIKVL